MKSSNADSRPRRPRRWLLALIGIIAGASVVALLPRELLFHVPEPAADESGATGERWACAMMDYIGTKPGTCPVCGMTLQKVTAGELTREQQRRMGVELADVTEGPATATVRAYGTVRYDDRTLEVVIPRVGGRIVKRHPAALHAGTLVRAGEPVIELYSPEAFAAQGELAAAVALGDEPTIRALRERFERWNLASVAQAVIGGAAPVDTITITSPFAGRVVLGLEGEAEGMAPDLPRVGQEVGPDTPLIRLVDPHAFILVIYVPEPRARWVQPGQPARLASDDLGELPEVAARIAWVAPELNKQIRAREVHIHLQDPQERLLAGSLVNARVESSLAPDFAVADPTDPDRAGRFVLVPKTAVLSTGVRNVAWRVAERQPDGRLRFELAPLALGPRIEDEAGNDLYVVRAGLQPGDEVATQGAFLIDSQAQLAGTPSLLFPVGAVAPAPEHQH